MKLTPEQLLEKKAREAIKRLINRVSSEYSFKKWRNLHGYLHSIGRDDNIAGTQDKELTRPELDELLRQYEEAAFKLLENRNKVAPVIGQNVGLEQGASSQATTKISRTVSNVEASVAITERKFNEVEEKFTEKNNYGLSKSEKESVVLFWFQKKASAELLKGFNV